MENSVKRPAQGLCRLLKAGARISILSVLGCVSIPKPDLPSARVLQHPSPHVTRNAPSRTLPQHGELGGDPDTHPYAYASLLTADILAREPHLVAYRDHIVLGNDQLQVVFAGVPEQVPTDDWQKTVVAIFRRTRGQSSWQLDSSVLRVSLRRFNGNGMPFYPIAMDMGQESEGHAFLTVVYTDKEGGGSKTAMTWRLDPTTPALALVTASSVVSGMAQDPAPWQLALQMSGQVSATARLGGETAPLGARAVDMVMFSDGSRVRPPEASPGEPATPTPTDAALAPLLGPSTEPSLSLALLSYQPFAATAVKAGSWAFAEPAPGLFGLRGFTFLFGHEAAGMAHSLRLAMQQCKRGFAHALPKNFAVDESFHLLERCHRRLQHARARPSKT